MLIEVHRLTFSLNSTIGLMAIDGVSQFSTLEPPRGPMLIPAGTYHCVKTMSPRMGYISPELQNVPGHDGERIHIGNDANDTHGCILVGMTRAPDFIGDSTQAFGELMSITPDEFDITITDQMEDIHMSSTTTPVVAAIHPSWFSRAGTWVLNEAKNIKNTIVKIAGLTPEIQAEIQKVAPTVEALSNLVVPGSGNFEAHLLDVWGVAASAVDAAGAAASANGISVSLDAALVAAIKGFLPNVKAQMSPSAGPNAPAPAAPSAS